MLLAGVNTNLLLAMQHMTQSAATAPHVQKGTGRAPGAMDWWTTLARGAVLFRPAHSTFHTATVQRSGIQYGSLTPTILHHQAHRVHRVHPVHQVRQAHQAHPVLPAQAHPVHPAHQARPVLQAILARPVLPVHPARLALPALQVPLVHPAATQAHRPALHQARRALLRWSLTETP